MKIDDIAKQLANKVNQEHYIKHYLEKVQRGAYNKGVKDAEAKQLILSGVSQQRELLNSFAEEWNVAPSKKEWIYDRDIESFVKDKTIL